MAPADSTQLSGNWKKLQEKLTQERKASQPSLKRKRPDEAARKSSVKRQKAELARPARKESQMENHGLRKRLQKSKSTPSLNINGAEEAIERPSSSQDIRSEVALEAQINEGVSPTALAGKYIAMDCEMVGFGPTPDDDSQLARVSLVNYHGHQLYDSFVLPQVPVTDYRTHITGITARTLKDGRPFKEVQQDVATLLSGRILVGHALKNDMAVLMLGHPKRDIRDTSRHPAFRELSMGKAPRLKKLAKELLGLDIQEGHHSSVEDARTCMLLYRKEKDAFETEHMKNWGKSKKMDGVNADGMASRGTKKKRKKSKR